jgi:hypothetical protein
VGSGADRLRCCFLCDTFGSDGGGPIVVVRVFRLFWNRGKAQIPTSMKSVQRLGGYRASTFRQTTYGYDGKQNVYYIVR